MQARQVCVEATPGCCLVHAAGRQEQSRPNDAQNATARALSTFFILASTLKSCIVALTHFMQYLHRSTEDSVRNVASYLRMGQLTTQTVLIVADNDTGLKTEKARSEKLDLILLLTFIIIAS